MEIYSWVDLFTLSRTKHHISRDFSDGVLAAEILSQALPVRRSLPLVTSLISSIGKG
jgi:hypothetical protein